MVKHDSTPKEDTIAQVVISVHDVAPSTYAEIRWLLQRLDGLGARPRVLKVVPNEDGERDLRRYPHLIRLLHEEVAGGSEVVLHGYTHRSVGPLRGPWATRLRGRLFAASAAEFLSLETAEMRRRLTLGRAILVEAGLDIAGFCAPGWLAPPSLPVMLRALSFRYLVGMATLDDLGNKRRLRLPWQGYMGAGALQERLIGAGGALAMELAARYPTVKVFLHPQGAPDSAPCRRILGSLPDLLRERRPVTYAELLAI